MERSVHDVKREIQMSGKPQFDEASVINAAMDVFWRHGYAASSIDQLTTAMGLSRSSLYKRFRDKDGLFREVLSIYAERVVRRMRSIQGDTRRGQLEALLHAFLPNDAKSARPKGCMLVRSCAEMADLPLEGQAVALEGLTRQRAILREILSEAAANGELPSEADIDGLAWHFLGVLQAVMNLSQAGASGIELRRVIDLGMSAWPLTSR
jgi:AcrR family transcriptional regulator